MTWIDLENTEYTISTGDDKKYTPFWFKAKRRWDFCIGKFQFIDVPGTLVKRGERQSTEYAFDIIFQGADHLAEAEEFRKSSFNKKAWTITHPHYGSIYVQPVSLEQDNTSGNQSRFTGLIIETLKDDGSEVPNKAPDAVKAEAEEARVSLNEHLEADLITPPSTSFVQRLQGNMDASKDFILSKIAFVQDNVDTVTSAYAIANSLINKSIFDTLDVANACSDLVVAPASFEDSVANRLAQLDGLAAVFNADVARIIAIYGKPEEVLQRKLLYENNMGLLITGYCETVVTNIAGDFDYRPDVLRIIENILNTHNGFLENLYTLQSANGGMLHAFIPHPGSITALQALVYNTMLYLFDAADQAAQQLVYVLPYDSNVILIANQLYPTDDIEVATQKIIKNNNIGLNELLVLRKGRRIVYYA